MAQLADRICQVERLKDEKSISSKYKKKAAYVEINAYLGYDLFDEYVEESEVYMIELKTGPSYVCKLLKLSNEKNPIEPNKNEKFVTKTYTFDITKWNNIFDLLVIDGMNIVPSCLKIPIRAKEIDVFVSTIIS